MALFLCFILTTSTVCKVYAAKIGDVVDYVLYTDIITYINTYPINSYNIDGYTVIVAEDLREYNFNVEWDAEKKAQEQCPYCIRI